jgi:hypothetical protein
MAPGATFAVYSANPGKTKLVITWHGITDVGSDDGTAKGYFEELPESDRTINMVFLYGARLTDVTLDWFGKHDIRMVDPEIRRHWKRISYGKHNQAEGDELFCKLSLGEKSAQHLAAWRREEGKTGEAPGFYSGMTLYTRNPGTPTIDTPEGYYPKGETVTVRLSNETKGLEMRYTLDGTAPTASSKLYKAPFAVTKEVVVKAGGFKDGRQLGDTARARFKFVAPGDVAMLGPADPGKTSPGLACRYYEGNWKRPPDLRALKPKKTSVAPELDPAAVEHRGDRFALVFDGFMDLPEAGVYTFHVSTAKEDACRVEIGGQCVIDNDMDSLQSFGLIALKAGKHPLRVVFVDGGWGERIGLSFRKLDGTKKQHVTKDMLSH